MTIIRVEIVGDALSAEQARAADLTPWAEAGVAYWRSLIEGEFAGSYWQSKGGGQRGWLPTRRFGNVPPPPSTLVRSGRLRNAWLGRGAGAVTRIGRLGAEFGVTGFPHAAVHRGGAGDVGAAESRVPFRIRVTERMRGYLAAVKDVHLKKSTRFITIPRRPHATASPELRTGLIQLARNFITEGRALQDAAA
jgi:hypothetical protein